MPPPAAIPSLECQGVNLRPPRHADATDLRRTFGQGPGSVDEVRTRIDSRFAAMARGVHAYWCVVPTGSEEAAGFVAAHNLDRPRDVVLSYAIAVEHRAADI